jgi:two-component system, NtrC family, sensor histidine kinase PilS
MFTTADVSIGNPETSPYWRLLGFSNFYRFVIACALVAYYFFWRDRDLWDNYNSALYLQVALAYLAVSLAAASLTWLKRLRFSHLLTLLTITDISFIVALIYAAGGLRSGLGLLLVVSIASASLISQGRLALFYAALASIALLLEQSYQLITWDTNYADYTHAAMLSLSCFATAWVGHSLAKRMLQSEALASQRGIDLENLAQINALIIQEMKDGVLVVDNDFQLRHHNFQAEDLLGNREQAWGAQTLGHASPKLAELMQNWIDEGIGKVDVNNIRSNPIKLSIEERELSIRFMPVGLDRKQGAVIFLEDWSQMQTQAQQLKLAALGRLTANIAHEIRNPLSAISHANQLLQEEEQFDAASRRMLQIIGDNVQRMDQIVQDVLELNRRDRTHQETVVLKEFLLEFHHQFCQVEKIPATGFEVHLGNREEDVMFDRRHLNQILWNLCRNGWRHGKQQKASLILSLHIPDNAQAVRMEITDDGPGVSSDAMQHLFEPFFTTESTGSGLGLYIARELCEANGGTIKYAHNQNGSQFTVYLKRHTSK